ncbi:MAG: ABC transporter ATP-binding protein/permease [Candidatus Nomurabacteria bacterium]|nr:ABC transporter ATP-binding protein/permease [Candidatus Nomurabacteria bacterium]
MKYLGHYWWQVLALFGGLIVQVWSSLQLPDMMSRIVNNGIVGGDQSYIIQTGLWMLIVALVGGVGMIISGFLAARIGAGIAAKVRADVFTKVMSFSITEINNFSTSSLLTRNTNDVFQVQMTTTLVLRMSCQAPIMGIGAILKALQTAPGLTWIIAMAVGVLMVLIVTVFAFALPKFRKLQKLIDKLSKVTRENLTGLRVVRAFNNEKYERNKFDDANEQLTRVNLFVSRIMVIIFPIVGLLFNFTALLVIWMGAGYIETGAIEIGNLMAFMQYAMQVMMSFMFLAMAFIMIPRAAVSWGRIGEVLKVKNSILPPEKPSKPARNIHGMVEFRNVSFAYDNAETPVLKDVSFTVEPGQTTAIIGSTGSGKSTLINLIPRFYDVTNGAVLVDGVDVKNLDAEELTKRIGHVPQKGVLFSGTIASNIAFGQKMNMDTIKTAARIAQASEFINRLPDKFKSHVAQGGSNVSGGQKQRLSIARAIAKKPEILIFDDSFSALDFRTDRNLRAALKKSVKDTTILIVAQRVNTIKGSDQIIVLDNGEIAGIGQHLELLKNCEVYREITASQLSKEEFAAEIKQAEASHG